MRQVKFAVVGCGHIGKRHAEMIQRNPQAQLVALIDSKERSSLNIETSDVPFFTTLEDFLSTEPEVDVINIATPNGLHAQHALQCLHAKKHVVIEKPLALTGSDAEKVISSALQMQKYVFIVMQNRFSPPSIWAKNMVDSGSLGKIYMVQLNCFWNRDEKYYTGHTWHGTKNLDGGTLFTQFSHFIDFMYWLFGDIENITAKLCSFNHRHLTAFEDSGSVIFSFIKGGIGSINFSTSVWGKNMESTIIILAENGSIKIGGQYMQEVEYCHLKNYSLPQLTVTNPANDYGNYKGSASNHSFIIQNVIDVINGVAPITTNALEGLKVVDIIERIYKAAGK